MSDFLLIRFPGKPVESMKGSFRQVPAAETPSGFVFSDFIHQRMYVFDNEGFTTPNELEFHFSEEPPVVISKRDYQIEAQALLNAFPTMEVKKAVYSRVKKVAFDASKSVQAFENACKEYPHACCYLVSSALFGTWIGATPELLLRSENGSLTTMALAGTRRVESEQAWEEKEMEEHQFVIDAIVAAFQRSECYDIDVEMTIEKHAGPVKHLFTPITAVGNTDMAWSLALDLHPTPAVCGTPRIAALDLIHSREMHHRDFYTGLFGRIDKEYAELYVNLRCAQLFKNAAYLYVGGGYTAASIPDLEWEETENKALTLLKILD